MIYLICIILIVSILVMIIYKKMEQLTNKNKNGNDTNNTGTVLFVKSKEIENIFNKINFKDYIKKFNKNEVQYKIKNLKEHSSLYEGYINNILDFTDDEKITNIGHSRPAFLFLRDHQKNRRRQNKN